MCVYVFVCVILFTILCKFCFLGHFCWSCPILTMIKLLSLCCSAQRDSKCDVLFIFQSPKLLRISKVFISFFFFQELAAVACLWRRLFPLRSTLHPYLSHPPPLTSFPFRKSDFQMGFQNDRGKGKCTTWSCFSL